MKAIEATVTKLVARIEKLEPVPRPLTADDHELMRKLLPAWAVSAGSEWLLTKTLVRHPLVAAVVNGKKKSELGSAIRRGAGHVIGGLMIEAGGKENNARQFRVVRIVAE